MHSETKQDDCGGLDNPHGPEHFMLRLYVAGASQNSVRAIEHLKEICDAHLAGNYTLEIIDLHQHKSAAEREQIVALPLLVKCNPLPERRLVGDMSNTQKVLKGLGLT